MGLPVKTTAADVLEIVGYLKNKPLGATLPEAKAVIRSQVLDGRKLTAYEQWGVVQREADRIRLTSRGWELARKPEDETRVFREILDSVVPYRSALEWMHHQRFESVTATDVGAHWHEHHAAALETTKEHTVRENVVAFFRLCEAAGLGQLLHGGGRSRQPTRFTVAREELRKHIEAGPSAPPWTGEEETPPDAEEPMVAEAGDEEPPSEEPPVPERVRVFIAHGQNMELVGTSANDARTGRY